METPAETGSTAESAGPAPIEKRAAALAHCAALLMFFVPLGNLAGPLAVLWTHGRGSHFVAMHASREAIYQAVVSLAAWTTYLFTALHGLDEGAHLIILLVSLLLPLRGAVRALRGLSPGYPWIG